MSGVLQDLRYAFRQIQKAPAFAAVAVVTLALGIGANTAIFSVVNSVLLRALPFKDADRLVRIWHTPPRSSFPGMNQFAVSPANYLDWQDQNHVFDSMAIYGYRGFTLTTGGKAEQVAASAVSAKFFFTLGVHPVIVRVLLPYEDQRGRSTAVVLSLRFWLYPFVSNLRIVACNTPSD